MKIEKLKIKDLKPYKNNAKIHTKEQIEQIISSIEQFGMNDPIGIWGEENLIVEGHGRVQALKKMKKTEVDCIRLDHMTDEQRKAYTLAHNKLTMNTDFDIDLLDTSLNEILNIDMTDFGFIFEEEEEEYLKDGVKGALAENYIQPPFSILDTRKKDWLDKREKWKEVLDSGLGRKEDLLGEGLNKVAAKMGTNLTGTSIFDPVLTEILVEWFSPKNGKIIDCFAGGSVRGIVSAIKR